MLRIIISIINARRTVVGMATMILQMKERLYGKWAGTDIPSGMPRNRMIFKEMKIAGLFILLQMEDCGMITLAPIVSATFAKHVPSEPFLEMGHLSAVPYPAANRHPNRQCKSNKIK